MGALLKLDPHAELDLPGRFVQWTHGRKSRLHALSTERSDAKRRRKRKSEIRIRIPQIGVVQKVKRVGAKSQPSAFSQPRQRKRPGQRNIQAIETRPGERVASFVSERARRSLSKIRGIEQELAARYRNRIRQLGLIRIDDVDAIVQDLAAARHRVR